MTDRRMSRRWLSRAVRWAAPVVTLMLLVLIWDRAVVYFDVHKVILPRPVDVWNSMIEERWELARGAWITYQAAALGLIASGLMGSAIAVLFSQSGTVRMALYPYVVFLQTVPIVAIAPLLILWFGNEFRTVVLVACIISIFPVISNVTSGLMSANENLRELFVLQSASRIQELCKLRIPAAIPHLLLGLRVSCGLAVIGAIVGEFFVGDRGSYSGLGTLITARQGNLNTSGMIAAVLACTGLGLVLLIKVNLLSATLLSRWTKSVGFENSEQS
jgi:NitT/TauT family transport system permease protein